MLKETDIQKTLSAFKPESIVFVISIDENNKPSGMVAAFKARVSTNPPLYAISIYKKGNTQKLIRKSKEFVIAVPNTEMEKAIEIFGYKHGNEVDKFKEANLKTADAKKVKVPLIKEATFNYECKLIKEIEMGDHLLFVGEVVAAHHNKDKKVLLVVGKDKEGNRIYEEF